MPDNASASPSSHPWELRDERFRASQAKATGQRNNGAGTGSASSPPLQHSDTDDTDSAEEQAKALASRVAGRDAEPQLVRPQTLNAKLAKRNKDLADLKAEFEVPEARRGLAQEVKLRMIELFAQFQGVSAVQDTIKSEYGLALDRRTVESFNPDSPRCKCGKRLKTAFSQHRDAYIKETAKHGVAHQAHRLRLIGTIVDKATTAKDFANALKGLELAAKEMGGLGTVVEHKGTVAHIHGTVEDARREVAERLKALIPTIELEARPIPSVQKSGVETKNVDNPITSGQERETYD